ncbi:MAG: peptide-methionine (R)-S-oxide reductase, partial [Roseibacillus sp.]|nr:peptide-methionine (R)-S-oxide reductase [Roseibacillus sp.]
MKSTARIFTLAFATGLTLMQLSCDDANADGKEEIKVEKEPPAQPQKPVIKTEEEWKKILTPEQFEILRKHGTERAWGKVYAEWKKQGAGTYYCVGCNAEL